MVLLRPSPARSSPSPTRLATGFNTALQGSLAPGSTMKVITAAMLIDKGLASPDKPHPCPKYFTYGGWKFQNDDKFEIEGGTFAQSFARSCNTAFISQAQKLENDDLTKEAQRGLRHRPDDWQIGIPTFDGRCRSSRRADGRLADRAGRVRMNPLNMASVSATVRAGTFQQPYIVSPSLDDRTLAKASRDDEAGHPERAARG